MPESLKHKPQGKLPEPPRPVKQQKPAKDAPQTSAQTSPPHTHQNLTLADWMTVYSFINDHPDVTQADVVKHFATLQTGRLVFDQSTLSHKL
ncbi:hypothetical protein PISMIDRAFT_44121, partial [Pisolithus microcarpus 441]